MIALVFHINHINELTNIPVNGRFISAIVLKNDLCAIGKREFDYYSNELTPVVDMYEYVVRIVLPNEYPVV